MKNLPMIGGISMLASIPVIYIGNHTKKKAVLYTGIAMGIGGAIALLVGDYERSKAPISTSK